MKKNLFYLFLFISLVSKAQITIDSTDMPIVGDTLRFSVTSIIDDSTLFVDYQASGPNMTWNFDSLSVLRQGVRRFELSSNTKYNQVPNRTGLLIADTLRIQEFDLYDLYSFYKTSNSSFTLDYRGVTAPVPSVCTLPSAPKSTP